MTDGGFHGHTSDLPEGWADRPSFDPKKPLLERLIEYGLSPERAAYMVAKQAEPPSAEQEELRLGLIRCGFPPERAAAEAAQLAREGMRQVGPDRRGWFAYAKVGAGKTPPVPEDGGEQ